jgi:hypothetical protein
MSFNRLKLVSFLKVFMLSLSMHFLATTHCIGQASEWQQEASYYINVTLDDQDHTIDGIQKIIYINNSPDALDKLYFHLFFNAFQPGSMMDVRSRTIPDPDSRVGDRIANLIQDEIGFIRVSDFEMNGMECKIIEDETILEVLLPVSIQPGDTATLMMNFNAQIPIQIRRSGRFSKEGVHYSMSQWYPKMCQYDNYGWHANPYIGREFYGMFGTFDVSLWLDPKFVVGATGYLKEERTVKFPGLKGKSSIKGKKQWRFVAHKVHDFVWAADPNYTHKVKTVLDSIDLHFYYIKTESNEAAWEALPIVMEEVMDFATDRFGPYPFKKYSFIQGGDGGMEYPMATLITGERSLVSLVGVSIHEVMHHWYHMVVATNETLYPWMDEGFTNFATAEAMNHLRRKGLIPGKYLDNPHRGSFENYKFIALSGGEESLSTHADHYQTNTAYGVAAYSKGALFLVQLEYIIGTEKMYEGLRAYYKNWGYKHPGPYDCLREFEKVSGHDLNWFLQYWMNTTYTIDYAIDTVFKDGKNTCLTWRRLGAFPMPLDFEVTLKDGSKHNYTIPLRIQRNHKSYAEDGSEFHILDDWPWVNPTYSCVLPYKLREIESIVMDPSERLADLNRDNNIWPVPVTEEE